MTWKNARKLIDARRERVAQLHLRGITEREIVAALEQQGFINLESGKPFSLGTICADLQALRAEWRVHAARDVAEHKAEQLAELAEAKRAAWAAKKTDTVIKALQLEVRILGTDSPIKIESKSEASDDLLSAVERLEALRAFYEQLPADPTHGDSPGDH